MSNQEKDNLCPICLNKILRNSIITHCGHKFHRNCLRPSIKKCPMCRRPLVYQIITHGIHYEGNFFECKYNKPISPQITIQEQQRMLEILNELEGNNIEGNNIEGNNIEGDNIERNESITMKNRIFNYIRRLFN
jgi:hypothetical protein